jgi:hypothetical protein
MQRRKVVRLIALLLLFDLLSVVAWESVAVGAFPHAPIGGAFKGGQLFEKVFETSQGKVGFLAETIINKI